MHRVRRVYEFLSHASVAHWLYSFGGGGIVSVALKAFLDLSWPWLVFFGVSVGSVSLAFLLNLRRPRRPSSPLAPWIATYPDGRPPPFTVEVMGWTGQGVEIPWGAPTGWRRQQPLQEIHSLEVDVRITNKKERPVSLGFCLVVELPNGTQVCVSEQESREVAYPREEGATYLEEPLRIEGHATAQGVIRFVFHPWRYEAIRAHGEIASLPHALDITDHLTERIRRVEWVALDLA